MEEKTIIIRRESALESSISDIISFAVLGAFFWFNQNFIGGSYFVNFLILLLILVKIFEASNDGRVKSYKDVSKEKLEKIVKILEEK